MNKILVGPRLRRLRRDHKQTQAEMAAALGISTTYVNLLENNQRSLSIKTLMAISDAYGVDWHDLIEDDSANQLNDLRHVFQDSMFTEHRPDLEELRAAVDHAPQVVEHFLRLYRGHRSTLEKVMRMGSERMPDDLTSSTPEAIIYGFFRRHSNYFGDLERAAERLREETPCSADDVYAVLKARLLDEHGIRVDISPLQDMSLALRIYDKETSAVRLSDALDHPNRVFQLAHVLCLVEFPDILDNLTRGSGIESEAGRSRLRVELANYFAAALVMPYNYIYKAAEATAYDVDRLAAQFGASFEQVCHRLTTLQREGKRGVPFFFLRVDRAGNVTKRFNATSLNIAESGGPCPVWHIHAAFSTPGNTLPQFVELPDGQRFFTINRSTERPSFSRDSQNRRMSVSLGCALEHAHRLTYAKAFNLQDDRLFSPIGINCHVCPRQSCSQRAHQPLHLELPIDPSRRGNTRYES